MSHAAGRGESNDLPFMKGTYRVPFFGLSLGVSLASFGVFDHIQQCLRQ